MKKILFINPPVVCVNECQQGWYSFAHPTSILKLIAWHSQQGNKVSFIDCMNYEVKKKHSLEFYKKLPLGANNLDLTIDSFIFGKSIDWLKKELQKSAEPDEVWISCHISFNNEIAHQAISVVREVFNKTKIVFGGTYPTLFPEHARKSGATIHSGLVEDAKTLFPDYSLFQAPIDYIVFQLDLGCENKCSHCVNHKLFKGIVRFDIDKLVEDIKYKQKKYKVDNFINIDPNVAMYDLGDFLEACIRKKLNINLYFYGGIQPDMVTKRLVSLMKEANVKGLTLPRELDSTANKKLHKRYSPASFHTAVKLFQDVQYDMSDFHCSFPVGLEYDCLLEIASIINEMNDIGTIAEIAPVALLPETPEYKRHLKFLEGKSFEELNWALWPTLDSVEKIQTYSKIYNLAHGNRFNSPWEINNNFSTG